MNDTLEYDFGSEPYIEEKSEEEDNLNDTLVYDLDNEPCIEEKFEEQKTKDNCLMADWNTNCDAETEDLMLLKGSVALVHIALPPRAVTQPHDSVHDCNPSTPSSDLNKDATHIVAKNGSIADLKDDRLYDKNLHYATVGFFEMCVSICLCVGSFCIGSYFLYLLSTPV